MNYGIFINDSGLVKYARKIAIGEKPIETRKRNTLKRVIGKRVKLIETGTGKPVIIGSAIIKKVEFKSAEWLDNNRKLTLIPAGSRYDISSGGKYCYYMASAKEYKKPIALPPDVLRHGFSWCEW